MFFNTFIIPFAIISLITVVVEHKYKNKNDFTTNIKKALEKLEKEPLIPKENTPKLPTKSPKRAKKAK